MRVFGGFDICVSLLNDPDTLNAELIHLHDQHNERGIPHEYFDVSIMSLIDRSFRYLRNYFLYNSGLQLLFECLLNITHSNLYTGIPPRFVVHRITSCGKLRPRRLASLL